MGKQNRLLVNMLSVYDRLGQVLAKSSRPLQQQVTLDNGYQPLHDADGQRKSDATDVFLPRIRETEPQAYVREVIKRQQELSDLR